MKGERKVFSLCAICKKQMFFFKEKDYILFSSYNFIHCDIVPFAFDSTKELLDRISFVILFYKVLWG